MQEIAKHFKEEFTELLSRYKSQLPNNELVPLIQKTCREQLCWRNNPELMYYAEKAVKEAGNGSVGHRD